MSYANPICGNTGQICYSRDACNVSGCARKAPKPQHPQICFKDGFWNCITDNGRTKLVGLGETPDIAYAKWKEIS